MAAFDPVIRDPIEIRDVDVAPELSRAREKVPLELTGPLEHRERLQFLTESLQDRAEARLVLERVLQGDELQPANYLMRGAIATRAIARVAIGGQGGGVQGFGTGFLIAPGVLITNNHVLSDATTARFSQAQFQYELGLDDAPLQMTSFALRPDRLFETDEALDFTVVAVENLDLDGAQSVEAYGCLPLLEVTGKAFEGEWLTIVQHPNGERKQLCVRENKLLKRLDDMLWYSTDTKPGASGSPVFNNDWYVVALHHAGIPDKKAGRLQTVDGRDYDPATMGADRIRWIANEGVRASRIVQTLKRRHAQHPLLQPLFAATPASARIVSAPPLNAAPKPSASEIPRMNTPSTVSVPVEIALEVQTDGSIVPRVLAAGTRRGTSALAEVVAEAAKKKPAAFNAPFDDDYSNRKGFDPSFLGANNALRVDLPTLTDAIIGKAVEIKKAPAAERHILKYHNYSVVLHKDRMLALYSAANVSFARRYEMSRPEDVWRIDPRVDVDYQLQNWYYARNNFDRGHLTRREDLEFGDTPVDALQSAADTCHWTNCTPQHSKFNQNKAIWQGIERHLLENAIIKGRFNAQVITGPVLDEGDPEYQEVPYPLQFWKVVAALNDEGKLFATAFIASQQEVIDQFGIEVTEPPIGPFKTFQVKVAEVERLTGLKFTSGGGTAKLSAVDPLEKAKKRRRRSPVLESTVPGAASGYYEIVELDDVEV